MSIVNPEGAKSGLIERVKAILLKPAETWDIIDAEPATVGGLYKGYIIPLALIPAVCGLIGSTFIGVVGFRMGIVGGVISAVVGFALTLLMVWVLAKIIDALAPSFGGQKSEIQAFKVATYSMTAGWIAGVFSIFPPLAILAVLGALYGLYLLYLGLPKLMKAPPEKALGYTAVTVIVAIVLNWIVIAIGAWIVGFAALGGIGAAGLAGNTVRIGDTEVDVGKMQAATKQMEAAARQIESGEAGPVTDPNALKGLLPASLAGFTRTEVTTGSGGAAGVQGSQAEGIYTKGDSRLTLSVTDLGAAGALAGMAGAFNVQSSSESGGKTEKIGKVDGRLTTETYDRDSQSGDYTVLVGDRFMVAADGSGVSLEELKAAASAVGYARLEGMAKR